jgi:hypothetical protein
MSLLDHESFCFDSLQKQLFWFDDFEGDQLKDEWYQEGAGGSAMLDGVSGGVVRLTTETSDWSYSEILWNNGNAINVLSVSKNVASECRSALKRVTYNESYFHCLIGDSNALIMMYISDTVGSTPTYICYSRSTGTSSIGSGVSATTNYFISRIQTSTQGGNHVHYYLDGIEANNTISTNISTQNFCPMHACAFMAGGSNAMHLDVDYSAVRQDR